MNRDFIFITTLKIITNNFKNYKILYIIININIIDKPVLKKHYAKLNIKNKKKVLNRFYIGT